MKKPVVIAVALVVLTLIIIGAFTNGFGLRTSEKTTTDPEQITGDVRSDGTIVTGEKIPLAKWNARTALPKSMDVAEITVLYESTAESETALLASSALAKEIDKTKCSGPTIEAGAFAQIEKFSDPGPNRMKIKENYYIVSPGPGVNTCYPATSFDKYYSPNVLRAIQQSLEEL